MKVTNKPGFQFSLEKWEIWSTGPTFAHANHSLKTDCGCSLGFSFGASSLHPMLLPMAECHLQFISAFGFSLVSWLKH